MAFQILECTFKITEFVKGQKVWSELEREQMVITERRKKMKGLEISTAKSTALSTDT